MRKSILFILLLIALIRVGLTSRIEYKEGALLRINSKVSTEPNYIGNNQKFKVQNLYIVVPLTSKISYGDRVILEGRIQNGILLNPKIIKIDSDGGILIGVRRKIIKFYRSTLPKEDGGLISGMVLGSKEGIGFELWDKLKKTGTAHVVVASGSNIILVSSFLSSILLNFFKRKTANLFLIIGIWCYVVLSGMDAPIIRAALMSSILLGVQLLGRPINNMSVFIAVLLGMIVYDPTWIYDWGFILSFAACFGLIFFTAPIERKLKSFPGVVKEGFSTSLAASIGVSPILYFIFGYINILSPFINTLVLWTVTPIMIIGMASGILSIVSESVARLILLLTYPLTQWFLFIVNIFS